MGANCGGRTRRDSFSSISTLSVGSSPRRFTRPPPTILGIQRYIQREGGREGGQGGVSGTLRCQPLGEWTECRGPSEESRGREKGSHQSSFIGTGTHTKTIAHIHTHNIQRSGPHKERKRPLSESAAGPGNPQLGFQRQQQGPGSNGQQPQGHGSWRCVAGALGFAAEGLQQAQAQPPACTEEEEQQPRSPV